MIDTAEKRRAAAHVSRWWMGAGVTPNVLKDAEWRAQAGRSYLLTAAPPIVLPDLNPPFTLITDRLDRTVFTPPLVRTVETNG